MNAEPMKKEIPQPVLVAAVIAVLAVVVFLFWYATKPAGVTTKVPPKPNPPGGAIVVE